MSKEKKVFVKELFIPRFIGSYPLPGEAELEGGLGSFLEHNLRLIDSIVSKTGYVDSLRFDELGYSPESVNNDPDPLKGCANSFVERLTYCLVKISTQPDKSSRISEFRILYKDLKGETLATSIAVISALKDAFIHRKKLTVTGVLTESSVRLGSGPPVLSDRYIELQSIELLRD